MAMKRKITRKVFLRGGVVSERKREVKQENLAEQEMRQPQTVSAEGQTAETSFKRERSKRECFFCKNKSTPSYTDLASLRRYLTDRAKIVGRERSGICSKHQRGITKNIKYARHLVLLPFVPKV